MTAFHAPRLRSWTWPAALFCIGLAMSYAYLSPLSRWMFSSEHSHFVIGNGDDDIRASIWVYEAMVRTLKMHPSWYFYGAIFTDLRATPDGSMLWVPWLDRFFVPVFVALLRETNVIVALNYVYFMTSFGAMVLYAREMKWPKALVLASAIAFAFTPYVRARSAVHPGFAAIYFIPLLFVGIERVCRESSASLSWRRWAWPAAAFLMVGTSAHYYLVITLVLSPLLLIYAMVRARALHVSRLIVVGRLALAAIPLVAFLGWNLLVPAPAQLVRGHKDYPATDKELNEKYLHTYSAVPVDYVTGELTLKGKDDMIARREALTAEVVAAITKSNAHEKTNGIRWALLAVAAVAMGSTALSALHLRRSRSNDGYNMAIVSVTFYALVLSMGPQWLVFDGVEYGPSKYVLALIPHLRVASRWGPIVNFGVICLAMSYLDRWGQNSRSSGAKRSWFRAAALWIAPLGIALEQWPRAPQKFAQVRPLVAGMNRKDKSCGAGTFVPMFGPYELEQYEMTRGTSCSLVTPDTEVGHDDLKNSFGVDNAKWQTTERKDHFARFVECTGLSWVAFRPDQVATTPSRAICERLGWTMVSESLCRRPQVRPAGKSAFACVNQ